MTEPAVHPSPAAHASANGQGREAGRPDRSLPLSPNARIVLEKRYLRRGPDGRPAETVEEMFGRVARHVAAAETEWGGDAQAVAADFYDLLTSLRFFPNSPTFTGAGTPLGQLAACFVLPISDDMGRTPTGIFETLRNAALIQQTGGGNGFDFSRLRPEGAWVSTSAGRATGPVGFLRVFDAAFGEVAQGGSRRGANMGVLRVDHPDIEAFIACKTTEHAITNFNISVGITDAFMRAVEAGTPWALRFPDVASEAYGGFDGTLEQAEAAGVPIVTHKTVQARELFDRIVRQAHHNGEPGVLFLDTANRDNPVPHLYRLEATNPCGEQFLGPFENCCLGSINLARHFGPAGADGTGTVDWDGLRATVALATRFLDDVVTANAYVPAVPQLRDAALRARRIGLGIMGLGDLLYHCGVRYGSPEGEAFAGEVMAFVRFHCMRTSIELARERGPFPALSGSIYDPVATSWRPPAAAGERRADARAWGRPDLDWSAIAEGIRAHGIRNACQTTVAPTGTIATVAGCEAYGCEPVFALAYVRHVDDGGRDLRLTYASPLFEQALARAGLDGAARRAIVDQVLIHGSCQRVAGVPEAVRHTFVVSQDISAESHVRMQAAIQRWVDNSISKTNNFPADATVDDVAQAYHLGWRLGCKGLTVYVTGSRDRVVLETLATAQAKAAPSGGPAEADGAAPASDAAALPLLPEASKRPRPTRLDGCTIQVATPLGESFVTVNGDRDGQPFEVFVTTAKAGSETAAVSEAIGRLVSYALRLISPVPPRQRLAEIVHQLGGIGGGRSIGFGPNRVASLPDGVARALAQHLDAADGAPRDRGGEEAPGTPAEREARQLPLRSGDLCPDCGHAALVNEEGCRKCYSCGFSQC